MTRKCFSGEKESFKLNAAYQMRAIATNNSDCGWSNFYRL